MEPREILERYEAVLFDMDGVLTTTARLHAASWKQTFDEFLGRWDEAHGSVTAPFLVAEDYVRHVDGKPRDDGVRDFLASRAITLPEGEEDAPPGEWSVRGIGNRKQALVEQLIDTEGVEPFPGSVAWLREVRTHGLKTAVVSSSRNTRTVLQHAGIASMFDAIVDGDVAIELGLLGKPAPDMFLEAARRLDVSPRDAVVVEDALVGAAAGHAGGFGLVIGVDRTGNADALRERGADLVVGDLGELVSASPEQLHPAGPKEHRLRAAALRLLAADDDFPVEPYRLVERRFSAEHLPQLETLFAVSNGYLGLRGTHDEGAPAYQTGALLNGFYETWPIVYAEPAYGFARIGQTILNVTDGSVIRLYVDDEPFELSTAEIHDYERALDMTSGTLDRRVVFRTPDGRRFEVRSRRLASLEYRHLVAIEYSVMALDAPARLTISSELVTHHGADAGASDDPRRGRGFEPGVLQPVEQHRDGDAVVLAFRTRESGLEMACGVVHQAADGAPLTPDVEHDGDSARAVFRVDAEVGRIVKVTKFVAYHHGRAGESEELCFRVMETLRRARQEGFARVLAVQRERLHRFWDVSDVRTEGAPLLQQAVRFSLFQLLQASARVEGFGIPAKGLTGQGYEGHYFWDAEIYVMPFLVYTAPHLAKSLLRHRYAMLGHGAPARELGHAGALYPWRTINGEEASAYYAAGTAQYHINADIAYAVMQYVRITGDDDFLARYGAEMLVETARLWADLGFFSPTKGGQFVINGVTGPDEYSTVVDNNLYTNLMARQNLRAACWAVDLLATEHRDAHEALIERTGLQPGEPDAWRRAADAMYVPYDQRVNIHLQDDEFLEREVWDFDNTPADRFPLLLHYHPLVIYRHQVIKQADVVLATFLLGDEFTAREKRRIFDYYDPLTTGDSSLSESIQSVMAAEVGDLRAAEEYFVDAASVDLADQAGNVRDGIHVASAGGTWLAAVCGFGGLRDRGERLAFRPVLPKRLNALAFSLRVRGRLLHVRIRPHDATYRLQEGTELVIEHWGQEVRVTPDGVTVPLHENHRDESTGPIPAIARARDRAS